MDQLITLDWIRLAASAYFSFLMFFGISGYLMKNQSGFKQKQAYINSYGSGAGTALHFSKVVLVPGVLALMLASDPVMKLIR